MSSNTSVKYYCRHELVPYSEDQEHEFKGHLCVSKDEVDPLSVTHHTVDMRRGRTRLRPTRAAASRSICGFLNTGLGGTIFLGVLDSGIVEGHPMTEHRKRHFLVSLKDTLSRFKPSVACQRIAVSFVPVLSREEIDFQESQASKIDVREDVNLSHVHLNPSKGRPHLIRTYKKCWCIYNSLDELTAGVRAQRYVIEIRIKKWNPWNPHHASVEIAPMVSRHRFHASEDGKFYYRGHGSVRSLSETELRELTELHEQARLRQALNRRYEQLEERRSALMHHRRRRDDGSGSDYSFTSSDNSVTKS